jgi:hypothetical protein
MFFVGEGRPHLIMVSSSVESTQFPKRKLCARSDSSLFVSFPVGNKRFRDAVTSALDDYMEANSRFEKSLVITSIADIIRASGGRFLKWDFQLGKWYELTNQQSKEKVGHAIRDAVNAYESKTKKDSKDKNKEQAVRKGHPRSERQDSGVLPGSSSTEPRAVYESFAVVLGRPVPIVVSGSGPTLPSHAIVDTSASARCIDDDGHDHQEQQFLAQIDAVLGPLSPDAKDPMEPYLEQNE